MASTSSKVWLTLAAAIGTLVIAGVVVTAPSVQRCQGQEEGLWACLRGDLIEFGLLPDDTPERPVTVADQPIQPTPATPPPENPPEPAAPPAPDTEPPLQEPAQPAPPEAPEPARAEPAPTAPAAAAEIPAPAAPAAEPAAPAPDTAPSPAPPEVTGVPPAPPAAPALQPQAGATGDTAIAAAATVAPGLSLSSLDVAIAPLLGIRIAVFAEALRLLPPATSLAPPEIPAAGLAPPATAIAEPPTAPELAPPADAAISLPAPVPAGDAASPATPDPPLAAETPPGPTFNATATASASPGARATIAPTIDAIEIDGSSRFIAGAGMDGSTVDLYVGRRYIGSAEVEGGRWLFEARGAITGDLRVVLAPEAQGRVAPGTATTLAFNVAPTGVRLVGKQAAADLLPPQPESELELTPASPALQAFVSVDPEMLRFRSGKAIIRRGDTLWAIARRVYGRGALYPLIFEANREQVRRPGRIFPGQVLTLPQAR